MFVRVICSVLATVFFVCSFSEINAQTELTHPVYEDLKRFSLTGGKVTVNNFEFTRDRVKMTLNGTIYFAAPVQGKVTGAYFVGTGNFLAEVPNSDFEKAHVRRMLNADVVESDFKTAVFRFHDDTFDVLGRGVSEGAADAGIQKLALENDGLTLAQTGANIPARLAVGILNKEAPGFFFGTFDGGKRGRFNYVFDPQTRLPTMFFNVNGGEKGLIFRYQNAVYGADTWLAFYALGDYKNGYVTYSDANDLVDIERYEMDVDLRNPRQKLALRARMTMLAKFDDVSVIPFSIGEGLGEYDNERLKKNLHVRKVRFEGKDIVARQEDWESGFTVFLPRSVKKGEKIEIEFDLDGDFVRQPDSFPAAHYPRSTTSWYPRHGYLDRATYLITFLHDKKYKVATSGVRLLEEAWPEDKDVFMTKYKMDYPVALMTFALAMFKRHTEPIKWDNGDPSIPLEYNSLPEIPIKEDFIMAELNNSVRYFHALFGKYPYPSYGAAFHPFGFGQGFPSMIMIPNTDTASKYTFEFIAHETAHQWWGNIVAWRSYRDQWLSEGFAEYSGVLYTSLRKDRGASLNLIKEKRASLTAPPDTSTGIGKGKIATLGPLILGHRLSSSKSRSAYSTLVYNKGGLVLRMLHFLFSDPASGNGDQFFAMMKDFVEKHRDGVASTDDFIAIANRHFVNTPIAKKYNLKDLNWFFRQWVYEAELPSYKMTYEFKDQPDGSVVMTGELLQENVSENFAMILPVRFKLGGDKSATVVVVAVGPKSAINLKLPMRPQKAELDPDHWILSEKTETK